VDAEFDIDQYASELATIFDLAVVCARTGHG
jgi:hypothetical protein